MQRKSLSGTGQTCIGSETSGSAEDITLSASIASSAAFPAKIFPTPGKGQDLMEPEAGFSLRPFAWFANYDREQLCWRTWQGCLLEGWTEYLGRWPRSGLMRSGIAYQLPPLVRRISGTGFSWLPTPAANEPGMNADRLVDKDCNPPEHFNQRLYDKATGRLCQKGLSQYVRMWPTPRSTDGQKGSRTEEGAKRELERGKNVDLGMVVKLFPTPTATDGKGAGKTGSLRDRLDYAAERGATKSHQFDAPPPTGGQLNPQWVSWLMGFPVDWCDLPGESQPEYQTESTSCDASETP